MYLGITEFMYKRIWKMTIIMFYKVNGGILGLRVMLVFRATFEAISTTFRQFLRLVSDQLRLKISILQIDSSVISFGPCKNPKLITIKSQDI